MHDFVFDFLYPFSGKIGLTRAEQKLTLGTDGFTYPPMDAVQKYLLILWEELSELLNIHV